MQRDTRKQESYFCQWIEYDEQASLERQARIDAGKLRPYGAVQAASRLFDVQVHRLVMRYSRGDDMSVLGDDLRSTFAAKTQLKNLCDALPADEQELREMYERLSEGKMSGTINGSSNCPWSGPVKTGVNARGGP